MLYSDMLGVDFNGDGSNIDKRRFAYLENMYRDYESGGAHSLESIPGFRRILMLREKVHSIFSQRCGEDEEYIIVHAGKSLYRFNIKERDSYDNITKLCEIADSKSHAFTYGGSTYVLDGKSITRIGSDGSCLGVDQDSECVYVPTLFINGVPHEQRNLLTNRFWETVSVSERALYYKGTKGLIYERLADGAGCRVVDVDPDTEGEIFVPAYVNLGGTSTAVKRIEDNAFRGNKKITSVRICEGITEIGSLAFYDCTSLISVSTPSSIISIGTQAFLNCSQLKSVYLGRDLKRLGLEVFGGASALEALTFGANEVRASSIENYQTLPAVSKVFSEETPEETFVIPITSPTKSITSFTVGGENVEYTVNKDADGFINGVVFSSNALKIPNDTLIIAGGILDSKSSISSINGEDFTKRILEEEDVIGGCRVSTIFDGRIFIAGNPNHPNTVFYSLFGHEKTEDKLYFGALSYFDDGVAAYATNALVPMPDALAVIKSEDDGCGCIFCHQARDGGDFLETVYPVSNIHTGFNSAGAAISLFDEAIFLGDTGLCAIKKNSVGNRYVASRSSNVNPRLLTAELPRASITHWCGYIVVQIGEEMFLADTRSTFTGPSGEKEYEWYYVKGVGTYTNATPLAKYASFSLDEAHKIHPDIDSYAKGTVLMSTSDEYGRAYYVRDEDGNKYSVYVTGESEGGIFNPATCVYSDGTLLFFGTENGDVCIFNNDKRGIAPDRIANAPNFSATEYAESMGKRIHPDFYGFANKAPLYALKTKLDNCGIPHLEKSTARNSLSVRIKNMRGTSLSCEVLTDSGVYRPSSRLTGAVLDFTDINFEAFSFDTRDVATVIINDSSKGWVEKQICVFSKAFRSPIAVSSIGYRYRIKGKIKRN